MFLRCKQPPATGAPQSTTPLVQSSASSVPDSPLLMVLEPPVNNGKALLRSIPHSTTSMARRFWWGIKLGGRIVRNGQMIHTDLESSPDPLSKSPPKSPPKSLLKTKTRPGSDKPHKKHLNPSLETRTMKKTNPLLIWLLELPKTCKIRKSWRKSPLTSTPCSLIEALRISSNRRITHALWWCHSNLSDEEDWYSWSNSMKLSLLSRQKLGFIDGTIKNPADSTSLKHGPPSTG